MVQCRKIICHNGSKVINSRCLWKIHVHETTISCLWKNKSKITSELNYNNVLQICQLTPYRKVEPIHKILFNKKTKICHHLLVEEPITRNKNKFSSESSGRIIDKNWHRNLYVSLRFTHTAPSHVRHIFLCSL